MLFRFVYDDESEHIKEFKNRKDASWAAFCESDHLVYWEPFINDKK